MLLEQKSQASPVKLLGICVIGAEVYGFPCKVIGHMCILEQKSKASPVK